MIVNPYLTDATQSRKTWDGGGADDNWSTPQNWVGDVAPVANDDLHFAGTVRLNPVNNVAADTAFNGLTFDPDAGVFTLAGNRIALNGNVVNASANVQTINQNLIAAAPSIVHAVSAPVVIGGVISGTSLKKMGGDLLTLSGANTYTGGTEISGGSISVSAFNNLGAPAGLVCVDFTGHGTLVVTNSFSTVGKRLNCSGSNRSMTFDIAAGKTLTVGDMVTGSGAGVTQKNGLGTLKATVINNNFTTNLSVNEGTIEITDRSPWGNDVPDQVYMHANTTSIFTKDVAIVRTAQDFILGDNITYISNRETPGAGIEHSIPRLFVQGNYTINILAGANVTGGTQTFKARIKTFLSGSVVFVVTDPVGANLMWTQQDVEGAYSMTFQGTGDSTVLGVISLVTALVMAGSGTLILSGVNTYTGMTTISSGTLRLTGSLANTPVAVNGGTFTGRTTTGTSATVTGTVTVADSVSAIIQAGSFGNNVLNTGALTFSGANSKMIANSTAATFSLIAVTGDVALGGCTIDFPAGIVNNGTYKLITATGTMSGALPSVGVNGTGKALALQQTGNDLEVVVS